jgi:hypothetical protein
VAIEAYLPFEPAVFVLKIRLAYSRNKQWFRQYIGGEVLFPPIQYK